MVLRGLCIVYEVCLLKVCYFYFLSFREDISVTNKVDGEQRWWTRFGAVSGFCRYLCILWLLVFFLHYVSVAQIFFVRINPENTTYCTAKRHKTGEIVKMHCSGIGSLYFEVFYMQCFK